MSSTRINRKYVARLINEKARHGEYYTGSGSRAVAIDIVKTEGLHPVFIGKIDDILVEMIANGTVATRGGELIPVDGVTELRTTQLRRQTRRRCSIRSKRRTAVRKRTLQVKWHEETLAI